MIDKNLIARRLTRLDKNILRLRQLASTPYEEFIQSEDLLAIAKETCRLLFRLV